VAAPPVGRQRDCPYGVWLALADRMNERGRVRPLFGVLPTAGSASRRLLESPLRREPPRSRPASSQWAQTCHVGPVTGSVAAECNIDFTQSLWLLYAAFTARVSSFASVEVDNTLVAMAP